MPWTWPVSPERLAEARALAWIGSLGDKYDNAMAESTVGLCKTECVRPDGPFRTVDELELATLIWVDWFNTTRLHSWIGDIPPIEFEANHCHRNTNPAASESAELSLQYVRGGHRSRSTRRIHVRATVDAR